MKYDEILDHLGQFGKYQKIKFALLCLPSATIAMQIMAFVYILAVPKHRCAIPGLPNDTYAAQSEAHSQLIRSLIPIDSKTNDFSSCRIYNASNAVPLQEPNNTTSTPSPSSSCDSWVYDDSQYTASIVTKFNLVCEEKMSTSHAQMIFMLGGIVVSIFIGPMADAFGRKKAFLAPVLIHIVASFLVVFSPSFPFQMATLFINGVSCSGLYIVAFVLSMEIVGVHKRILTGIIMVMSFGIGVIIVVGAAYLLRDWQHLQIAISIPPLFYLSYFWLVDESPRWLISKGRYQEATVLLEKMARINGKDLPTKATQWDKVELDRNDNRVSFWNIRRFPKLVIRTLIICLNWFVCNMTYYGLALNVSTLAGSVYLNSFLYGVVEIASYVMCILLLDRVGRKILYVLSLLLAGVACVLSPFPELYLDANWLSVLLAITGKFGVSAAFAIIWIYSTELYPTAIRNSAVSCSSLIGRMGKIVSPYIANLGTTMVGDIGKILPLAIFGGLGLLAGVLAISLPETKNTTLPESLEESDAIGRTDSQRGTRKGDNSREGEEELKEMMNHRI